MDTTQAKYMIMKKEIITTIKQYLTENESSQIRVKTLKGETFYHQTQCQNVENIQKNNFISTIHQGQARYTHGVYFLSHPNGSYGECTLSSQIYGNFIDFSEDDLGDDWIQLRDSFNWNNYEDLTTNIREKYNNIDGLLFSHLLVVWYPNKSIKNIKLMENNTLTKKLTVTESGYNNDEWSNILEDFRSTDSYRKSNGMNLYAKFFEWLSDNYYPPTKK